MVLIRVLLAIAYVESKGKCVYCGKELLGYFSDFYTADIDHLLPKSKYPELESVINNWVLICRACNSIKGKMDISDLPWTAVDAVKNHKHKLIIMIGELLKERRTKKKVEFEMIKTLIKDE